MIKEINIMHISDLHFGTTMDAPNGYERKEVLKSFLRDLVEIPEDFRPSILIISGDIAYQGVTREKTEEFTKFYNSLYDELKTLNNNQELAVLSCPGNHDRTGKGCRPALRKNCDQDAYGKAQTTILEGKFRENFSDYVKVMQSLKGKGVEPYISKPIDHYSLGKEEQDHYLFGYRVVEVSDTKVLFVALNSAWLCNWKAKSDAPFLAISNTLVQNIFKQITDNPDYEGIPIVSFMHHPFEFLNELERTQAGITCLAKDRITEHSELVFFGHTHIPYKEDYNAIFHGGALQSNDCLDYSALIVKLIIVKDETAGREYNCYYKYGSYALQPVPLETEAIWRFTPIVNREMKPTNYNKECGRIKNVLEQKAELERLTTRISAIELLLLRVKDANDRPNVEEAYEAIIAVLQEYVPEETLNYELEPTDENLNSIVEAIEKKVSIGLRDCFMGLIDILRGLTHSEEFENTYRTDGKRLIKKYAGHSQEEENHE